MDDEFYSFGAKYENRDIKIILVDGTEMEGYVDAIIPREDTDDDRNYIVLNINGSEHDVFIDEIKHVKKISA